MLPQVLRSAQRPILTAPAPGLALRVQGADIVIADIYDWPIEAIVPLVKRYSGL